MSKSAHVPIFTGVQAVWVALAKLYLVLFWMIKLFYTIVSLGTVFTKRAIIALVLGCVRADLTCVAAKRPSLIL